MIDRCVVVCVLSCVPVSGAFASDLPFEVPLYDADFEAPFHTLGETVSRDLSSGVRRGPSQVTFGNPFVGIEPEGTTNQVLRLEGGPMQQVRFEVGESFTQARFPVEEYVLDFDLTFRGEGGSVGSGLTVFFDSPTITRLDFRSDGTLQLFSSNGPGPVNEMLGTFERDTELAVSITFHPAEQMASFALDGVVLYDGPIRSDPTQDLRRVRLSLNGQNTELQASIDNFKLSGFSSVPAPGPGALLGGVACALLRRRRR